MNNMLVSLTAFAFLIGVTGCSSPDSGTTNPQDQTPSAEGSSHHGAHGDHDHGDTDTGMTDMEKMKAELAKLSPEDAASAMKQHFCPVTGDMLGTTGPPIKVDVEGRPVWICCESCQETLLENPSEYLSKLKG